MTLETGCDLFKYSLADLQLLSKLSLPKFTYYGLNLFQFLRLKTNDDTALEIISPRGPSRQNYGMGIIQSACKNYGAQKMVEHNFCVSINSRHGAHNLILTV